jgi:SAM-dependent methyltransferase
MSEDYEYRGLVAASWDLLRGDTAAWPDRPFYRTLIERFGGPALDVGCGTGRLLLDYLADGFDIDGVDNSPQMLDLCRSKARAIGLPVEGRLFQQSMDALDLPRRYGVILVPSSSFQLLTEPEAAARAMRRFTEHLAPGGLLVMSIMSKLWRGAAPPPEGEWTPWSIVAEQPRPEDGAVIRRWMRARYHAARQVMDEENRYERLVGDVVVESELHQRSPSVRWYSQAQAAAVFEQAGLESVRLTAGFSDDLATDRDTTFCVLGRRPVR